MTVKHLYSIFFILSSVSIFFFFISPLKNSVDALTSQLRQKRLEYQTLEQYFQEIENILEKLSEYSEEISKIDTALPEDPSLPHLFDFLYRASMLSGVLLESVDNPSLKTEGDLKKWTTTLTLKGEYSSFKDFISVIEKSARLIKVENISITQTKETPSLSFKVTISVFSY